MIWHNTALNFFNVQDAWFHSYRLCPFVLTFKVLISSCHQIFLINGSSRTSTIEEIICCTVLVKEEASIVTVAIWSNVWELVHLWQIALIRHHHRALVRISFLSRLRSTTSFALAVVIDRRVLCLFASVPTFLAVAFIHIFLPERLRETTTLSYHYWLAASSLWDRIDVTMIERCRDSSN